jgi:hypothetical protein
MKTSLKNLKKFIENNVNFASSGAQDQAMYLLQRALSELNQIEGTERPRSVLIKPLRSYCFMI